jgi:hypothetical protein
VALISCPDWSIVGHADAALSLSAVSRPWSQVVTSIPRLWSTIVLGWGQDDHIARCKLFLSLSANEPVNVILLDYYVPTALSALLFQSLHRIGSIIYLPSEETKDLEFLRLQYPTASPQCDLLGVYESGSRHVSAIPLPPRLRVAELSSLPLPVSYVSTFTQFQGLESLSLDGFLLPTGHSWAGDLLLPSLQNLFLRQGPPKSRSTSERWLTEFLSCPKLQTVHIRAFLPRNAAVAYIRLEASLTRFPALRIISCHITLPNRRFSSAEIDITTTRQLPQFRGKLEKSAFTFWRPPHGIVVTEYDPSLSTLTEQSCDIFAPCLELGWQYIQCPAPQVFTQLTRLDVYSYLSRDEHGSDLPSQVLFPLLQELYFEFPPYNPRWLELIRAPRLVSLHVCESDRYPIEYKSIPDLNPTLDISHISQCNVIQTMALHLRRDGYGARPNLLHLPQAEKICLRLQPHRLVGLYSHFTFVRPLAIAIVIDEGDTLNFREDWASNELSPVETLIFETIDRPLLHVFIRTGKMLAEKHISNYVRPFRGLSHLGLPRAPAEQRAYIDGFVEHLVEPDFLPVLTSLCITECPVWGPFFYFIRHRQVMFLTRRIRAGLKEITVRGRIHGLLLEGLREALTGKYCGSMALPLHQRESSEWPSQPFDPKHVETQGLLSCYVCFKAGLELGCTVKCSEKGSEMLMCDRHPYYFKDWESNTVFSPWE